MDDFDKFYNKALRFLSFRPRSEKEIRDYFKIKNHPAKGGTKIKNKTEINESIIELVLKKLKEKGFINDEEFAKWWVEQRTSFRPLGLRLIKIELRQKGISDEMIESGIMNQESGGKNDLALARKLIEKRLLKYKNLSKQKLYQKLGGFLARRGFDWETIKQAIDEAFTKVV